MQNDNRIDSKNIIHSNGIIDENYAIISADEELYCFLGPTVNLITDVIHQVDMDDFLYVMERLNVFAVKNMVLRMRRYDNTFRWCLVTVSRSQVNIDGKEHTNIEISDIINLNNHYLALTKAIDTTNKECKHNNLLISDELLEKARKEVNANSDNQIHMLLFGIDNAKELIQSYGEDAFRSMKDEIFTELVDFVGERGYVAKYQDSHFLVSLKNVGSESNLRSFIESSRTKIRWMYVSRDSGMNMEFTVGVSEYPRNGRNFDLILHKLFRAYELAQNKGGNCYVIYKEELHGELELGE